MATVLITGGTGMIGKALTKALLEKNYEVIVLTRNASEATRYKVQGRGSVTFAEWNIEKQTIDEKAIAKADHIIHLAGANLGDKRWTKKRKREIVSSRVDSCKLIVDSLKKIPNQVKTVISSSAIGYYGPDLTAENVFKEDDPPSNDFLGTVCQQWEESIHTVTQLKKRLVLFRTGVVLSKEGGMLPRFLTPLRFGLAPILGNGKQILSWILNDDLVRLFIEAIEKEDLSGVYNAVAPKPVSNKEFVLTLAKSRNKFFIPFPVPSFVLKIILGEMSIEVLKSATVSCEKILQTGFSFKFQTLATAIDEVINR